MNRQGAKNAKGVFIALRAGYSTFVNSVHNYILNRKDAKDAKVLSVPFPDRNPGETKTKKGFTGQADDQFFGTLVVLLVYHPL